MAEVREEKKGKKEETYQVMLMCREEGREDTHEIRPKLIRCSEVCSDWCQLRI